MSEWLDSIGAGLKQADGPREVRLEVWRVAQAIDAEERFPALFKSAFHRWVHNRGFMQEPEEEQLPWSVLLTDAEVEMRIRDRQKYSRADVVSRAIEAEKRDQRARWERRIEHAVGALLAGWSDQEAKSFICALDEWQQVEIRIRRRAA